MHCFQKSTGIDGSPPERHARRLLLFWRIVHAVHPEALRNTAYGPIAQKACPEQSRRIDGIVGMGEQRGWMLNCAAMRTYDSPLQ